MSDIPTATIKDAVQNLRERVGVRWIEEQTDANPSRPPHPLATLLTLAHQGLDSANALANQSVVESFRLAQNVETLLEADEVGCMERFPRLLDDYLATAFEFDVAARYSRAGHSVQFVKETTHKTQDLLVDEVAIECKHKGGDTQKDARRSNLYGLLRRRLEKVVFAHPENLALIVRFLFEQEPEDQESRLLLQHFSNYARSGNINYLPIAFNEGASSMGISAMPDWMAGDGNTVFLPIESEPWDYSTSMAKLSEEGGSSHLLIQIKCMVEQDRVSSFRDSLKKARRQLPPGRPSIIHVDTTSHIGLDEEYIKAAGKIAHDYIGDHEEISAISIDRRHWQQEASEAWRLEYVGWATLRDNESLPDSVIKTLATISDPFNWS